jgi:hypothetical protein
MSALGVLGMTSPASADDPSVVQNKGSGRCLHHNGSGVVRAVDNCSRTNGALQWHVHDAGEMPGTRERRVVSPNGGLCLDSNSAGAVYTNPCQEYNRYQMWEWIVQPDNVHNQVRNIATGRCLGTPSNAPGRVNTVVCPRDDDYPYRLWRRLQ